MNILIYLVATLFIFVGAGSLLTKSRSPYLRAMTSLEHLAICLSFLTGGILAVALKRWIPLLIGLIVACALRFYFNLSRRHGRLPDSPPLPPSEFANSTAVNRFIDWWISNDSQVREVRDSSTKAMWNEGHRPSECKSVFPAAEDYFRHTFQCQLIQMESASEAEWVNELQNTGRVAFQFLKDEIRVGEEYGVDFKRFNYDVAVRKIVDPDALNNFKYYRLSEILLANQRRLLMWLFHCQFGKWYTPQS